MRDSSGPANDAFARGGRDRHSQTLCHPRSLGRARRPSLPEMRSYLGRLIEVLYISRLRPNRQRFEVRLQAPQGRQQHSDGSPRGHVLWWKSPAILQRQEPRVAPVQRCWSTPTLLETTKHPPARVPDVIQASFLPGPHRLLLSSLMHGAAAKMALATRVPQRTRQLPSFELWPLRVPFIGTHSHVRVVMVQSCYEMRQVFRRREVNVGGRLWSSQGCIAYSGRTSVQIASPAFCNCRS